MDRRSFVGVMAATTMAETAFAQVPASKKPGCYLLQHYRLQLGSQATRLSDYLSKVYLPALAKVQPVPTLVLDAQLSEHLPLVTIISAYSSVEQAWSVQTALSADKDLEAATDTWQAGAEPPFDSMTTELLEAVEFSPDLAPLNPQPKAPRIFEMRVYQTRTLKGLRALKQRFAEGEVKILARAGAQPVLFGTTAIGSNNPNLTWVIAFADMEAREKFNTAFNADPDWIKLRQQSLERYGQIPSFRRLTLYRATAYSPVR
ncbi:MAG: NIPSNAP family protein [Bryobacteraceae bacterium]|jgi:hypothetical protein